MVERVVVVDEDVRAGVDVVAVVLRVVEVAVLREDKVDALREDEVDALRVAVEPFVAVLRVAVVPDAVAVREVAVTERRWNELSNVAEVLTLRVAAARFCSTAAERALRAVSARRASI